MTRLEEYLYEILGHSFIAFINIVLGEKQKATSSGISNLEDGMDKKLPSFWIPSLTPNSKPTEVKKPVSDSS